MATTLPVLFAVGTVGGLLFDYLKLPGGAMTGAMIAVVLCNTFSRMPSVDVPHWLQLPVYVCVGVIVGNMYKPGMLLAVRDTWGVLLGSTLLILLAGCLCTWLVARSGVLSVSGAYLATSPGGLNAIMGLSSEMGQEAPIVLVYHLVRLYAIVLLAPYIARLLGMLLRH